MYAMIDFGGNQIKVVPGEKVLVFNLNREAGEVFDNTNVLMVSDDGDVAIGKPYVEKASVKLEVVKNFKGKKLIVFKKLRRKASKVKRGFRPSFTQLKVLEINK